VRLGEHLAFSWEAMTSQKLRSVLMLLAMSIGVAAVVVLTALGEGARRYVVGEFASLGTNLVVVMPGYSETTGFAPFVTATPRDLTLDDAESLLHSPAVAKVAPVVVGTASVSYGGREREAVAVGTTAEFAEVRHLTIQQGRFIPPGDPERGAPVLVIGSTIREALFGSTSAVGDWVRVGDRRFRVIGELESSGQSLGMDLGQMVVMPVNQAQALLDTPALYRVLVQAKSRSLLPQTERDVTRIIKERHEGKRDVTVITQDSVLSTFDRILSALTLTVAGIAGISLVVAGILVMNVMLVSVSQRTAEIGLLKALGATGRTVLTMFLAEAALMALAGAVLGLALGYGGVFAIGKAYPDFPVAPPLWAVAAAVVVAFGTGLGFGVWPARRAARLDPVAALSRR
jgi:putative ABC transport system permease protein